jgi:signal transduction histidine kinase
VPWAAKGSAELLLRHLADIGAGTCNITTQTITDEADPEMRQILSGLLVLHEDLVYARELREQAESRRAAVAAERERLLEGRQEAIEARDRFLAVASHELRTPITTLTLQMENLADGLSRAADDPAVVRLRATLPVLKRQIDRLTALVLQLLNVSRITTGRLELSPSEVDLSALTREVIERFELEVNRRRVQVDLRAATPVVGFWDGPRLDQVVTNLFSNALKYGDGRPVDVIVKRDGESARLEIRDHGIGISPEDREKLFAPFTRAVQAQHYGGLGLGLWISSQIVQASGGTITVESQPGQGSTFIVELPVAP